jgi:streptomycin 6-kinase
MEWRLVPEGRIVETPTSLLLPLRSGSGPAMLKLLKGESDERRSAAVLRHYDGHRALRLIAADDAALPMERANDEPSLTAMALSGGDENSAHILATVVAKLHVPRARQSPAGMPPLRDWFGALFAREHDAAILGRCCAVARRLLRQDEGSVLLHGDLHHGNVLASARGWLAIGPKGVIGERSYEVANLLGNPFPAGEIVHDRDRMLRLAKLYAECLGLDVARVLAFALAHAGLSACWSMEDGDDAGYRLACAAILDPLVA